MRLEPRDRCEIAARSVNLAALIGLLAVALPGSAQTPEPAREWSPAVGFVVVEAAAFGSGLLARSTTGARLIGGIHAVSGLTALSVAFFDTESGLPEVMVPYGIGLLGLSWYNLSTAESVAAQERFWTNAIGVNVVVLTSVVSAIVLNGHRYEARSVKLQFSPGVLRATISFDGLLPSRNSSTPTPQGVGLTPSSAG